MRYVTVAAVKDLLHGRTLSLLVSTVCIILQCKDMHTAELPTGKLARMGLQSSQLLNETSRLQDNYRN